jgi:hypothetical protein
LEKILVIGNGPAADVLTDHFTELCTQEGWMLNIITDIHTPAATRREHISHADVVISFAPASLQQIITEECIEFKKHLLSPSPLNEKTMKLRQEMEAANILCLYELGFDPGLDHMSVLQLVHGIQEQGGKIISLHTHSGRIPAPESGNNPWHHKTADAKQLVNTGKHGAVYKEKGNTVQLNYADIFNGAQLIEVPGPGFLAWYPVQDSMGYIPLYGLKNAATFIRTNLCHPDFMYGWKNIVDLKLTDETPIYDTNGMTLAQFFRLHFEKHGFAGWVEQKMTERFNQTKEILDKLMQFMEVQQASELSEQFTDGLMIVDEKGKLENISLDSIKDDAAAMVIYKMHEANLTLKQLEYLGMNDEGITINKGLCSAADVLEFMIERKLRFTGDDADMSILLHEVEYEMNGRQFSTTRRLVVKGQGRFAAGDIVSAVIIGIAVKLVLTNEITLRGLHIPVKPHIYEPIMEQLAVYGVKFV